MAALRRPAVSPQGACLPDKVAVVAEAEVQPRLVTDPTTRGDLGECFEVRLARRAGCEEKQHRRQLVGLVVGGVSSDRLSLRLPPHALRVSCDAGWTTVFSLRLSVGLLMSCSSPRRPFVISTSVP